MGIEFLSIKSIADGKITNDCTTTDSKFDCYIPSYQRGYRWQPKQAIELLDDIWSFTINNYQSDPNQFYCIQPLVIDYDKDNKRYDIVDGQQRLTTIYIILKCLEQDIKFGLEYQTRTNSKAYLEGITRRKNTSVSVGDTETKIEESRKNLDFYCMYQVSEAVNDWIDDHENDSSFQDFINAFLNNVQFIKYEIKKEDAQDVFTRLNVGKIPLTSSELIKALLLNRSNFGEQSDLAHLKIEQEKIALKWDSIEYSLQNDELWYFIHGSAYNRPTRIDYILDLICINDKLKVKDNQKKIGIRAYLEDKFRQELQKNSHFLGSSSEEIEKEITKKISATFGDDEYSTFRYFNEYFNYCKKNNDINTKWLEELWKIIRDYYAIFDEWYHDYELYHYIGYIFATIPNNKKEDNLLKTVNEYVVRWSGSKEIFKDRIKEDIKKRLTSKSWVYNIRKATFEGDTKHSKRECYNLLLLHNIDTIIVQNKKLIEDSKYELPNFTKFPFHLFHKQNQQSRKWEIEHIRPDSGDSFKTEDDIRVYLGMTLNYLNETYPNSDQSLTDIKKLKIDINNLLNEEKIETDNKKLEEIRGNLEDFDDKSLSEEEKNMVWNYVLLDGSTNSEYGNKIFPIKRIFIKMKEQGEKPEKLVWENGCLKKDGTKEAAFITPCVKNVFSKFYTDTPSNMRNWTKDDAEKYLESIINMLERYGIKQK